MPVSGSFQRALVARVQIGSAVWAGSECQVEASGCEAGWEWTPPQVRRVRVRGV